MTELAVIIGTDLVIDAAPDALIEALEAKLSVPNPRVVAAARQGRRAWGEPERLCFVERSGDKVRVPRGATSALREFAAEQSLRVRWNDQRVLPADRLSCPSTPRLRAYQQAAVDALVKRQQGVFVLPAGAGKTRAAMGVIAKVDAPALILVGALDLAEQWVGEIQTQLGTNVGVVGGGEDIAAPITVALVQSLARWEAARLDAFLARFGLLVIDEAHHVPSTTFADIVNRCPAKYRLGLSATPQREDGLGPVLDWFVGPVLATVTHAELIAAGHLVAPELRSIETAFEFTYGGPGDWQALVDALWQDGARNRLIVDATAAEARAGHTVLVLTGRVEHAKKLAGALVERGISALALVGNVPKAKRTEALQAAREGAASVLVATQLADEGLDVPRLSRVVLAFPAKAAGRIEQRIGRIMRPAPGKSCAVVIDVVDARVGVLRHQARKRRAVFERVLGLGAHRPP